MPPEAVALKETGVDCPTVSEGGGDGAVMATLSAAFTVKVTVAVAVCPVLSVAVTVAMMGVVLVGV